MAAGETRYRTDVARSQRARHHQLLSSPLLACNRSVREPHAVQHAAEIAWAGSKMVRPSLSKRLEKLDARMERHRTCRRRYPDNVALGNRFEWKYRRHFPNGLRKNAARLYQGGCYAFPSQSGRDLIFKLQQPLLSRHVCHKVLQRCRKACKQRAPARVTTAHDHSRRL